MLNMKYIGSEDNYTVNLRNISKSITELKGDFPVKTSGFTLSRIDREDNWDYSAYTTIYRKIDGGVQFSNDGSVYVKPVETPATPYVPTLEEVKEKKIQEIINFYNLAMDGGTSLILTNGSILNISITQDFINTINTAYLSAMTLYGQDNILIPFEINNVCYSYSPIDIVLIYIAEQKYIIYNKSLKNELLSTINNKDTIEEVIAIEYTVESLDTTSLNNFTLSIENGNNTIQSIMNKYGIQGENNE